MQRLTEMLPVDARCSDCSRLLLAGRDHILIRRGPVTKRLCSLCSRMPEYQVHEDDFRVRG
jgi:hypothetical protein